MDRFKSAVAIAWISFCRWKRDLRIAFVFLFTALVIFEDLHGFTQYGLDMGQQCTIYMLPIIFISSTISVGTTKMVIFVGMLLLLCDTPFLSRISLYVIYRSGRKVWWKSGYIYIVAVTFIYTVFVMVISSLAVLPVASFSTECWGKVLEDMAFGSDTMSPLEIVQVYWHGTLPELSIRYVSPVTAQLYTFVAVWNCFIFLGLIMYLISQFTQKAFWILCFPGFFVFLDPILICSAIGKKTGMSPFSPVSWVSWEMTNPVGENQFLSMPIVLLVFIGLDVILIVSSWVSCLKRKDLYRIATIF